MINKEAPAIKYSDFLINQTPPPMEKDKEYVKFYLKHIEYCKSGVTVGGIYLSGWLYWHINFFKLTIDTFDDYGNIVPRIQNLSFRDNEFLLDYSLNKAYDDKRRLPLMIFGTRRFAKSVFLASRVAYKSFIFQNSHSVIVGASSNDINNITKYIDEFLSAKPDCFSDLRKVGNWSKTSSDIEIAYSKLEASKVARNEGRRKNPLTKHLFSDINTAESKLIFSRIAIRNLEHGQTKSKEEILAGITPTEVIFDECGKYSYKNQWLALQPAISTNLGVYRTIVLFVGTGGDVDMSKDAENYFLDADGSNFTRIDPTLYQKIVQDGMFPLEQKNTNTGLFVPRNMSLEGGEKKIIPFNDYVKKTYSKDDLEALEGFNIQVTDWKGTDEYFDNKLSTLKDDLEKVKQTMYYPSQPEDCFLVKGNNPFPAEQAKKTRVSLEENGLLGEYYTLSQGLDGTIYYNPTDLIPIKDFPFKGGSYDAPVVILEKPIFSEPSEIKYGTYIAGFDGYKINSSETTDSVGSFYIFKRSVGITGYRNQIVAHIASRPKDTNSFYRQCLLLLKAYNAELLPEFDTNLHNYLNNNNALGYMANCQSVVEMVVPKSVANTTCGLPSNTRTKAHYLELVKSYCWEEVEVGYDDGGSAITSLGIERIHDPMLLEEIENYRPNGNFDRIAAFGHALVWHDHLNIRGVQADEQKQFVQNKEAREILSNARNIRNTNSGKYRRRVRKR